MELKNALFDLPTLKTERLLLRKITLKDAKDMFEYTSDPEVAKYTLWYAHQSISESKYFIKSVIEQYHNHQGADWGIVHQADQKFIGTCGFTEWVNLDDRGEIGYNLSRKYWGKGYMLEAVRAILSFGFSQMHLNRIQARCKIANVASARVMEKVGMKYEGTLRQYIFAKGAYHDLKLYSILKQEFLP